MFHGSNSEEVYGSDEGINPPTHPHIVFFSSDINQAPSSRLVSAKERYFRPSRYWSISTLTTPRQGLNQGGIIWGRHISLQSFKSCEWRPLPLPIQALETLQPSPHWCSSHEGYRRVGFPQALSRRGPQWYRPGGTKIKNNSYIQKIISLVTLSQKFSLLLFCRLVSHCRDFSEGTSAGILCRIKATKAEGFW